ncbi:MAG TPA: LPD38 domain-containing protein [Fusibacter sp.]|nr:LPD38 domain-containing protein [Fusibacter sp.]
MSLSSKIKKVRGTYVEPAKPVYDYKPVVKPDKNVDPSFKNTESFGRIPTPTIKSLEPKVVTSVVAPVVPVTKITRDKGTPSIKESTQRQNAKDNIVEAKVEKETKLAAKVKAKRLETELSDKYGIDVKRANSPIEAVNMLSMVDDSQKEQFKKDFAEYSFAAERSNPFRAGAEAGFNILPTNLEKTEGKEDVQTAKGYGAGRLVGGIGQQLAFNSVLGPGIESLTSKLLPKASPFVAETIKDVAIGTGTQLAEAPFDKPTATQFAGNIALDIALNALFGAVGKGLSKLDLSNLKTAKPSQVVGDVAQKLNVSIVEADKVVDDAIDFYVNQSGVADTKPFEQLQLEAPKTKDMSDVSNTLSSKLRAKQSDLYVNQFGVADKKPFDQLQLEAPKNVNSDASVSRLSEKVKVAQSATNKGYHAGDLGKAEHFGRQVGSNRGTGHFGTGTYFVGNKDGISFGSYKERPQHEVDFDGYNLYKPKTYSEADKIHESLKYLNNNYISSKQELLPTNILDDLGYGEPDDVINDLRKYNAFDEEGFKSEFGVSADEYIDKQLEIRGVNRFLENATDNVKRKNKNILRSKESRQMFIENMSKFLNKSKEEIEKLADDIWEEVELSKSDKYYQNLDKTDSPSTRFMKKLGYEGVDVRHIKEMDDTQYGSVIYDLKQPKIETKPQLDRPSEFSIGAKYPPLAKDFAREVPKPARPRIEPTLKPITDFSVKKPVYPTLDPKFAKERPSVLTASDMKRIEPTLNVASKVDQPTTTMKIEPTLKPKKQVEAEAKLKAKQETISGLSNDKLADAFSGKISRDVKTKKPSFKERFERIKTQFVDDVTPLRKLETDIKGKLDSAESSIYKQARLFKGAPEKANEFIRTRLSPILTDIEKKGFTTDDLGDYALAVHARDVNNAGINSGFTNEEIDAVIKKYASNSDMEKARKDLLAVSDDLLEQLSADELIDANQLKALKEKWTNYMPLFRAFDDDKVDFARGISDSFSNVTAPIKKLSGSDRNVIDPIESMIKNIYQTTNATMRNRVGLQLSKLADIDVDNRFIRKLDDKELVGRKNVVNVTQNGKKVGYEVDPEVFRTFNNMDKETSNFIIDILAKPASVLRAGATLTPEFALRNPFRDIQTAFTVSESGFTPLDFAKGLASYIKKDEMYSKWLKEGGGYGSIVSMDRNAHQKVLKDILKTPVTDKFVNVLSGKALIQALRTVSDATESATKIGEFGKALSKGASPQEAAYRARDLMDFARAGSSVRPANKIVAFLNANIQGKSKLIRAIKERPTSTMLKMTTSMTLPTVGFYALNEKMANEKQRQTIDEAPDWLKNTFWLMAIPNTDLVARIPKPFDMSIFANGTERFLDYVKKNDKEAFDGFITQSIKDQSIPTMITGVVPLIEVMSNYSFFRQSPIVPMRESYIKKEDQYDNTTSEIAKLLSKGVRGISDDSPFGSPRAMDYLLKTSTAGLGTTVLDASDWLASSLGIADRPVKAEKGITNAPGLKGFLVSDTMSGKSVGEVYDLADKLQKEKGSLKLNLQAKYGDNYNADDLKRAFKQQEQLTYLNQVTDEMSDISKELRAVNNSTTMTPQEKRKQIEELTRRRNSLAIDSMNKIKEMGK